MSVTLGVRVGVRVGVRRRLRLGLTLRLRLDREGGSLPVTTPVSINSTCIKLQLSLATSVPHPS